MYYKHIILHNPNVYIMKKVMIIMISFLILILGCKSNNTSNNYVLLQEELAELIIHSEKVLRVWDSNIEGIDVIVESTVASDEKLKLINQNDADMTFVQNDVMYYAHNGVDIFSGEVLSNFSAMLTLIYRNSSNSNS